MNALPIQNRRSAHAAVDDLIADFGVRRVLLAIAARLVRKAPITDAAEFPGLVTQPGLSALSDHLRKDLGLPPDEGRQLHVDPILPDWRPRL